MWTTNNIAEFQVQKSEGKGTSCNAEKNVFIGPKCFISQVQQVPKVVGKTNKVTSSTSMFDIRSEDQFR